MGKLDELKADLDEMTDLRDKMREERDEARRIVKGLAAELQGTLKNKAALEWHLRCRKVGLDVGPMLGEEQHGN